jgi:iron(II)-dependent oxidoreductase
MIGPYSGGLSTVGRHGTGVSPFGVHDLAGNVSEWIADWYSDGYIRGDVRNPKGPATGTGKVIRGGGWYEPPDRLMTTRRFFASPDYRSDDTGFRCARDLASPAG